MPSSYLVMEDSDILLFLLLNICTLMPKLSETGYDCCQEMNLIMVWFADAVWKGAVLLLLHTLSFS